MNNFENKKVNFPTPRGEEELAITNLKESISAPKNLSAIVRSEGRGADRRGSAASSGPLCKQTGAAAESQNFYSFSNPLGSPTRPPPPPFEPGLRIRTAHGEGLVPPPTNINSRQSPLNTKTSRSWVTILLVRRGGVCLDQSFLFIPWNQRWNG